MSKPLTTKEKVDTVFWLLICAGIVWFIVWAESIRENKHHLDSNKSRSFEVSDKLLPRKLSE